MLWPARLRPLSKGSNKNRGSTPEKEGQGFRSLVGGEALRFFGLMSAAVQRRHRALERERANVGRHAGKKSSMALMRADHGQEEHLEEASSKTLDALLRARHTGGAVIVAPTEGDLAARRRSVVIAPRAADSSFRRRKSLLNVMPVKPKPSPIEEYLSELAGEHDGEQSLPDWFYARWRKTAAAVRNAEGSFIRTVGHRPSLAELRADEMGGAALAALEKLNEQRQQMLSTGGGEGGSWDAEQPSFMPPAAAAAGSAVDEQDASSGLFRGYSRELMRVRQLLANEHGDGGRAGVRAQRTLGALAQRAKMDASVLMPPPLPPGVISLSEDDDVHAKYIWHTERATRLEALATAVEAAASGAGVDVVDAVRATEARRRHIDAALALMLAEEKHERLCEKGQWETLLDEWREGVGGGVPRNQPPSSPMAAPPRLDFGAVMRQPPPGRSARRQNSVRLSARGGKQSARSASGGLSARVPFLRTGVDMPWVDDIAKQYGLEYDARQRVAGVAREMAAAGYTAAQARQVVLGLLHGTREKLQAAWRVFVTGNDPDTAVLSRAEWHIVLSMLTGGLGMSSAETDHLFQVFDKDGSGTLDYGEFIEVLEALPLQRPFEESQLGSAVGALQSLFVLNTTLVSRLSLTQLASAGRTISRLRAAGFTDDDASRVVSAIFLSRSRRALSEAWDVLRTAADGGLPAAAKKSSSESFKSGARLQGGRRGGVSGAAGTKAPTINAEGFKVLLPLLGEDLPLSRIERLFEEVDSDNSGELDFDEFVQMVRRLKPKGSTRNWRAAGASAFDNLTGGRTGKPRALRRAVPMERRAEAGALMLVLRDFGYDDDQLLAVLQGIYPPLPPEKKRVVGDSATQVQKRAEANQTHIVRTAEWAAETGMSVMRGAWGAFGGGELVKLPANPFDFKTRLREDGTGMSPHESLVAQSARYQCATGIDTVVLSDALTLLAEGLGFGGWPADVLAPLSAEGMPDGLPNNQIGFAQFCRLFVQMRRALDASVEAAADGSADASGFNPLMPLQPLLAMQGPSKQINLLSNDPSANPLLQLNQSSRNSERRPSHTSSAGSARGIGERLCGGGGLPSWLGDLGEVDLTAIGSASAALGDQLQENLVVNVVDPLLEIGETVEPMLPLRPETRALIPAWQEDVLARSVAELRKHGFNPHHTDLLVNALMTISKGGDVALDAARRAWRVLRSHASRFASEEALVIAADKNARADLLARRRERKARRDKGLASNDDDDEDLDEEEELDDVIERDANGRRVPIEDSARFDHCQLETEACKRMLWLLTMPLMKKPQLEAIFTAFDTNRDGSISFDELERLMRLLDPYKRLARLKPIDVPQQDGPLSQMSAAVAEAAAPAIESMNLFWANAFKKEEESDDDD